MTDRITLPTFPSSLSSVSAKEYPGEPDFSEDDPSQFASSDRDVLAPYLPFDDYGLSDKEYAGDPDSSEGDPSQFSTSGRYVLAPQYMPSDDYGLGYAEGDEDYAQFGWGPYGSDVADPLASAAGTQCHANLLNPGQLDGGFVDNYTAGEPLAPFDFDEGYHSDFGSTSSASADYYYYWPGLEAQVREEGYSAAPRALINQPTFSSFRHPLELGSNHQEIPYEPIRTSKQAVHDAIHDSLAIPGAYEDVAATSRAAGKCMAGDLGKHDQQFPGPGSSSSASVLEKAGSARSDDDSEYQRALSKAIRAFRSATTPESHDDGESASANEKAPKTLLVKSKRKNEATEDSIAGPCRKKKPFISIARNGKLRSESAFSLECSEDWEFMCPLPSHADPEEGTCGAWTTAQDAQRHLERDHPGFCDPDPSTGHDNVFFCPVRKDNGRACGKGLKVSSIARGKLVNYSLKKHLLSSRYHPGLQGRRKGTKKVEKYPTYVCRHPRCGHETMTYVGGELSRIREHWKTIHNSPDGYEPDSEQDDEEQEEEREDAKEEEGDCGSGADNQD